MLGRQYEIKSFPKFDPEKDGCQEANDYLGGKSSCFSCPFPDCTRGYSRHLIRLRRNDLIHLLIKQGITIEVLAIRFNVSERTIQRIIASGRG